MARPQHMFVLLGFVLLVLAHVMAGGYVAQLMQPGAFLVAVLLPLVLAMLVHRQRLFEALSEALGDEPLEPADALRFVGILRSTRSLFIGGGALGILLGYTNVLLYLDDPSKLGAWIAVGWIAAFYMVIATELCLAPMIRQLAIRGLRSREDSTTGASSASSTGAILVFALLLSFGLIEATHVIEGGLFKQLIQPVAFALIFLAVFFPLGWHGSATLTPALLSSPTEDSRQEDLEVHLQALLSLRTAIYAMAGIGYLLGFIGIMSQLDDPAKLGAGIAIATVVWIVAVLLAELVVGPPLLRLQTECLARRGLESPLERAARSNRLPVILLVTIAVVMLVLALYALEMAS